MNGFIRFPFSCDLDTFRQMPRPCLGICQLQTFTDTPLCTGPEQGTPRSAQGHLRGRPSFHPDPTFGELSNVNSLNLYHLVF